MPSPRATPTTHCASNTSGIPVPRSHQTRIENNNAGNQRGIDRYTCGLQGCQSQRTGRCQSIALACHADLYTDAAHLSEHLLPNTRAYYEIWLDEKRSLVPVRKRNQSAARTIYRVNSESGLPHHQSTMSSDIRQRPGVYPAGHSLTTL